MVKEEVARANRFHIGLFGRRNSGKSSLLNMLTAQQVSVVSHFPGTTTDVVMKNLELPGIGASVLVDTAGYDDEGDLGALRVKQTVAAARRVDLALIVVAGPSDEAVMEKEWAERFAEDEIPVLYIYNKVDEDGGQYMESWRTVLGGAVLFPVSAYTGEGREALLTGMAAAYGQVDDVEDLTGNLVGAGDVVLLVMPQDIQAPKGRLITPQVQTLRNLLDKRCTVLCCTVDDLPHTLSVLSLPPSLIITDSQVFPKVEAMCPQQSRLTSFSVLFARYKGDAKLFLSGAEALLSLHSDARVLIAEACTHVPQHEDIGRVKLPRLLTRRFGSSLHVDIVSGNDFPEDLSSYDLVIHCGACMFTRRHVLNRLRRARACGVPVTNYGIAIAALTGILDKVVVPD